MPYKELGLQYPFVSPVEIPMTQGVGANRHSGFRGYQSVSGSTSLDIDALVDLNVVKSSMEAGGQAEILYMVLSWNQNGYVITDLVFGAVWLTKVTVSASALLNRVSEPLLTVLRGLQMISRGDFKAYIDSSETPPTPPPPKSRMARVPCFGNSALVQVYLRRLRDKVFSKRVHKRLHPLI